MRGNLPGPEGLGKDLCSYAAFDDCLGHRICALGRPLHPRPARIRCCGPSPTASHGYTALPTRLTWNIQTCSREAGRFNGAQNIACRGGHTPHEFLSRLTPLFSNRGSVACSAFARRSGNTPARGAIIQQRRCLDGMRQGLFEKCFVMRQGIARERRASAHEIGRIGAHSPMNCPPTHHRRR